MKRLTFITIVILGIFSVVPGGAQMVTTLNPVDDYNIVDAAGDGTPDWPGRNTQPTIWSGNQFNNNVFKATFSFDVTGHESKIASASSITFTAYYDQLMSNGNAPPMNLVILDNGTSPSESPDHYDLGTTVSVDILSGASIGAYFAPVDVTSHAQSMSFDAQHPFLIVKIEHTFKGDFAPNGDDGDLNNDLHSFVAIEHATLPPAELVITWTSGPITAVNNMWQFYE